MIRGKSKTVLNWKIKENFPINSFPVFSSPNCYKRKTSGFIIHRFSPMKRIHFSRVFVFWWHFRAWAWISAVVEASATTKEQPKPRLNHENPNPSQQPAILILFRTNRNSNEIKSIPWRLSPKKMGKDLGSIFNLKRYMVLKKEEKSNFCGADAVGHKTSKSSEYSWKWQLS